MCFYVTYYFIKHSKQIGSIDSIQNSVGELYLKLCHLTVRIPAVLPCFPVLSSKFSGTQDHDIQKGEYLSWGKCPIYIY